MGFNQADEEDAGSLSADVSAGGVRIRVPSFIPLKTVLNLKIHLNNPLRVMPVQGRVVWVSQVPFSEHYDVGIEFMAPQTGLNIN